MNDPNILIVAATLPEIKPLMIFLKKNPVSATKLITSAYHSMKIELLITGIGMVATAYQLGRTLKKNNYDLCINLGLAGSFNKKLKMGEVVNITHDCFSELGAEAAHRFISFDELNLENNNAHEGLTGAFCNYALQKNYFVDSLQTVKGITVNTVHGNTRSISAIRKRLDPGVESMEGAAFIYCCLQENIPFMQIRAISNYVEKRNKKNWNIPLAINNLNQKAIEIIRELCLSKRKLN